MAARHSSSRVAVAPFSSQKIQTLRLSGHTRAFSSTRLTSKHKILSPALPTLKQSTTPSPPSNTNHARTRFCETQQQITEAKVEFDGRRRSHPSLRDPRKGGNSKEDCQMRGNARLACWLKSQWDGVVGRSGGGGEGKRRRGRGRERGARR